MGWGEEEENFQQQFMNCINLIKRLHGRQVKHFLIERDGALQEEPGT